MRVPESFEQGLCGSRRARNAAALISVLAVAACDAVPEDVDWPYYLGDGSSQHSTLDQITPANVHRLETAWVYHAGGTDPNDWSQMQTSPIVVGGILYGASPQLHHFALDAATGRELWRFDPFQNGATATGGDFARGVTYWDDGADGRIFLTAGASLFALNARSGSPIGEFGHDGRVDLKAGLGRDVSDLYLVSNTPGVIHEDLLILPVRVSEGQPAAPGHVRAYDARTGAVRWTFYTIPRPGEFGYDTWPADAYQRVGGANNWAGMSVDRERGIVYVPTGSATPDFFGRDRQGANLFANTLLALDAATGERIWHFQGVHHDIWDRDFPAPPNLVTVTRDGVRRDAVAQITKTAHVFLFDRDSGEPLFPIEERPYPPSDIPGERAWPTQPLPVRPPPFTRQTLSASDITDRTPEAQRIVGEQLARMRSGGQFVPFSLEGTIVFPGFDGGGEWGGAAVEPATGIMYVNGNDIPWIGAIVEVDAGASRAAAAGHRLYAQHCVQCHGIDRSGDSLGVFPGLVGLAQRMTMAEAIAIVREGSGTMPPVAYLTDNDMEALVSYLFEADDPAAGSDTGIAGNSGDPVYAFAGYRRFLDPDGYPAVKPPWATLNAIDLNAGEILWKVTLGDWPEAVAPGSPPTGAESYGGPIITAGGVIFIGATRDEYFRAFDMANGDLLWESRLPAAGYATPVTYSVDGRQFVVQAAGGGKIGTKSGDAYIAFALPE